MTAIWIANDTSKNGSYIQLKTEVLCTVSCLAFVKHFHPEWKTIFFVDKFTKKYYEQFGILELFDEVNDTLLNEITDINLNIFWAAAKIKAQLFIDGPSVMFDLDFRFYTNLEKMGVFENTDISCLWAEYINKNYLKPQDAFNNINVNWDYNWGNKSFNVSFLYIKDEEFRKTYCNSAIEYMVEASKVIKDEFEKFERGKYITFVEQHMLYELVKKLNLKVKVLIHDYESDLTLPDHIKGIGISYQNAGEYLFHYASGKMEMKNKGKMYIDELNHMHSITNSTITDIKYLNTFNKIYNISDNESCFC